MLLQDAAEAGNPTGSAMRAITAMRILRLNVLSFLEIVSICYLCVHYELYVAKKSKVERFRPSWIVQVAGCERE